MKQEAFEKYERERAALLKRYRKKKLIRILAAILIGGAVIALIQLLGGFKFQNFPVTIVFSVMAFLLTVLYLFIQLTIIDHRMQKELLKLEDEASDPYYSI